MAEYRSDCDGSVDSSDSEMRYYNVKTQNMFNTNGDSDSWTRISRAPKRPRVSSDSISSVQFAQLSTSDKLISMFESINQNSTILNAMRNDQKQCLGDVVFLKESLLKTNTRLNTMEKCMDTQSRKLKMLTYKSLDSKARDRHNNLVFWGITENTSKDCKTLLYGFLEELLGI